MERQIKFRAWDGDRIIYDNYSVRPKHLKDIDFKYFSGARVYHNKVECDFFESRLPNATEQHFDHPTAVYFEKITQFAEITDKNGKEIWEGDIVESPYNGETFEVKFWDGEFVGDNSDFKHGVLMASELQRSEVVGNIHQNPELL